jgi:hypothetical protein
VANVAAGLGCGRTNTWTAELRAALQSTPAGLTHATGQTHRGCIGVVAAAQQAFCAHLHAYSDTPEADDCDKRHFCKYATAHDAGR